MWKNKTKQYIVPIILLAAFAIGCESFNQEDAWRADMPGSNDTYTPLNNTDTATSSSQYTLEVKGFRINNRLTGTSTFTIKITKTTNNGLLVTNIGAADLPNLTLTATRDINDGTAATLQGGVNALTLVDTDIKTGLMEKEIIEKEVTIDRGTAETTFTITLTHTDDNMMVVQRKRTATVIALSKLPDLSITLADSKLAVHTGPSQKDIFNVEITSREEDVEVSNLGGITLQYNTTEPSNFLSYMIKGNPNSVPVKSGVTTLKEILEQNGVKKLRRISTTLQFRCEGTKLPLTFTNIKLKDTLAPDDAANYIPSITYTKPDVRLTVKNPAQGDKHVTLTIKAVTDLTEKDLEALRIEYKGTSGDKSGDLVVKDYSTRDLVVKDYSIQNECLADLFSTSILKAGEERTLNCTISPATDSLGQEQPTTISDLIIKGSADETPVAVTYIP